MVRLKIAFTTIITLMLLLACKKSTKTSTKVQTKKTSLTKDSLSITTENQEEEEEEEEVFRLTEENAIDFFFEYQKNLKEDKVKITTTFGSFTVKLYDNVPYHKANFIYLTKKGYFNNTMFHRIVKNFIIQGGNADNAETGKKRNDIGKYLLPPDAKKGHKHHRGTISMPSSEINNPYMLASPFEFFIVVTKPGSYHLDGDFTPFGRVIKGMDVVDEINRQPVDAGDWPSQNVYITKAEVVE